MKMKLKTLSILATTCGALALSNCASLQGPEVADYNGDGVISDAEARQYQKVAQVQGTNIAVEGAKRENAIRTIEGVERGLNSVSRIANIRF